VIVSFSLVVVRNQAGLSMIYTLIHRLQTSVKTCISKSISRV
jgi:hypothetical protein